MLDEYCKFIDDTPTYKNGKQYKKWNIMSEIFQRKFDNFEIPYCLFSTYFANTYFGLRQALEIDSLRYAIENLTKSLDRNWALGALIATVSSLGTTYGGHFAQPPIVNFQDVSIDRLVKLLNKRAAFITHEFIIRFLSLAEQSESSSRAVTVINGPWHDALKTLKA